MEEEWCAKSAALNNSSNQYTGIPIHSFHMIAAHLFCCAEKTAAISNIVKLLVRGVRNVPCHAPWSLSCESELRPAVTHA